MYAEVQIFGICVAEKVYRISSSLTLKQNESNDLSLLNFQFDDLVGSYVPSGVSLKDSD